MTALPFAKSSRTLPPHLRGEEEIFHEELRAIRAKLQKATAGPRIYRAGRQPVWLPPNATFETDTAQAAAAGVSTVAQPAVKFEFELGTGEARRRVAPAVLLSPSATAAATPTVRRPFTAHVVQAPKDGEDEARRRATKEASASDSDEPQRPRRRPVAAAVIVAPPPAADATSVKVEPQALIQIDTSQLDVPASPVDSEDEEERARAERRRRARLNAAAREEEERRIAEQQAAEAQRQKEAEQAAAEHVEEEVAEEEEDESSEYESDSDDDRRRMLLKPIFRSKAQRDTLAERDRIEAEERALEEERIARQAARKKESKLLVLAELQREVALAQSKAAANVDSDGEELDEPLDEEYELDLWKLRELRRLKRDRDARRAAEEEEAETERRRHMTDEEIQRDNERLGIDRTEQGGARKEDSSFRFLQRYYHKGGFFQDDESQRVHGLAELAQRDFQAPTGADRTVDRTQLPSVMQVKKFGLKGRTKYTHLTAEDTTRREENPWTSRNSLVDSRAHLHTPIVQTEHQRKKHRTEEDERT